MVRVISILKGRKPQVLFIVLMGAMLILSWYSTTRKYEFLFAIPILLVVATLAFTNFRSLWLLTILFVPLSINFSQFVEEAAIRFPTDILCIGLFLVIIFKILSEGNFYSKILSHPLFMIWIAYFCWQYLTIIPSWDPVISLKRVLAMSWMFGTFFFLSAVIFREKIFIVRYFLFIASAFCLAFCASFVLNLASGRNPFALRFNPMPFFDDHTALGAFTSMLVPLFVLFTLSKKFSPAFRRIALFLLFMIIAGLFFSYSRGAWASAFFGLVGMALLIYRRLFKFLIAPAVLVSIPIAWIWFTQPSSESMRNMAVSRKGGYAEHVQSITNWRTDYSNAERLNRWACAWKMFYDRPLFGFGPGTYMFTYGNYQNSVNRTPVSTNRGDNGTAHNEFLLALSETGLIGAILILMIFSFTLWFGIRGYFSMENSLMGILYLGCTFSLVTYIIHSFVNNFLDQDKVAVLFFGMSAVILAGDIFHKKNDQANPV